MKRKIMIITGTRAEYGYIRPLIKLISADSELDYDLIITGMHLLDSFGYSVSEIKKDGFKVTETIDMILDGYTNKTMVKSLAILMMSLPDIIERLKPDIMLVSGDRGEQLVSAIVGANMNIPVAHIQGGDISGNIDGITRHAITKLSHIHMVANKDSYDRVKNLGEEKFRIHIVGATGIDELANENYTDKDELIKKYKLDVTKKLILVVQHPVTDEVDSSFIQMEETMKAISQLNEQCIIIYPNSDAGNVDIRKSIMKCSIKDIKVFKTISRKDYLGLMKIASVLVGNSSSGIIEAPFIALPVVNIGNRQNGRLQGKNVINTNYNSDSILKGIKIALSKEFKNKIKCDCNVYGDGTSSSKILNVLKNVKIDKKLLNKRITY